MTFQIRSTSLVIVASVFVVANAGGCDKAKKALKGKKKKRKESKAMKRAKANQKRMQERKNRQAAAAAAARNTPGYALGQKLNHYIECTNNLSSSIDRSASRYFSWAGDKAKKPPSRRTRRVYGLYKIHTTQLQRCNKALNTVPASPDTPALTAAGKEYQAAVKKVVPLVGTAYAYYQSKGYKKDGMKMAAKYHPQLVDAFMTFRAANRKLRGEVGKIADNLEAQRLARMKAKGENFWYYRDLTMHMAKKVVRLVSPINDPKKLDTKKFNELRPEVIKTLKIFGGLSKSDPDARRWRHLRNFIGALQAYVVQLDWLYARATGKKRYSSTEKFHLKTNHPENIKGHPAAVVKAYNKMIAIKNRR